MLQEILDPRSQRLLWSLGYAIPLAYALSGWLMIRWMGPPDVVPAQWQLLSLWGAGALLTIAWWAVSQWVHATWRDLVRWSLAELVAMVGLVALALGVSWATFGVFLVWAAGLHLLAAPPRELDG